MFLRTFAGNADILRRAKFFPATDKDGVVRMFTKVSDMEEGVFRYGAECPVSWQ